MHDELANGDLAGLRRIMDKRDLHVEVQGDDIVVTLPGTSYVVSNFSPNPMSATLSRIAIKRPLLLRRGSGLISMKRGLVRAAISRAVLRVTHGLTKSLIARPQCSMSSFLSRDHALYRFDRPPSSRDGYLDAALFPTSSPHRMMAWF